jgi:hypothetical protein
MVSIFKIFNPKNWSKANVFGRLGNAFRAVPRKAKGAWTTFRSFAKKNKAWFLGIGGSVAAGFAVKGISYLMTAADQNQAARQRMYPNMGDSEISKKLVRLYSRNIIESANELKWSVSSSDPNKIEPVLLTLITNYQNLIHCFNDTEYVDFAVTADKLLGGAAGMGVTIEDIPSAAHVVSKFRVEKDEDENPESVFEDLNYLIDLDQTQLPLKMML